ncbi:MAG TPA: HAD family hydrolase [Myxococcales bacterium]|nr:HAD family hydrolase [Myxococcales bacterium]
MSPPGPGPAGVLFDLDGVLLRSEEVWFRLVEEAGRRYRGTPVTRKEFGPTFGQGTEADVLGFRFTCSPAQLDRFYAENFHRYTGEVWVDPEARPLLDFLAQKKIRRAVVTNTTTSLAGSLLGRAGLLDMVEVVSCADQVGKAKPAPDVVIHALRGLNLQAGDAWMVGDSRFDKVAAEAAGVRYIGLRMDGSARIESLAELGKLLEG